MGAPEIDVFDEDGVSEQNIPNQFYRHADVGQFKVDALENMLAGFTDCRPKTHLKFYRNEPLKETVIVATDSMASRKIVWDQFKKQEACRTLIEARMGAELGMVYTISKALTIPNGYPVLDPECEKFYEEMLYPDSKVKPLPCTARSIIYNVLMLASLIGRSYKGVINKETVPREQVFNMTFMDERSWMVRK